MEPSIYKAPDSDVIQKSDQSNHGSVEGALAGDYQLSIKEILKEAWEKTEGAKLPVHLGYLVLIGITVSITVVFGVIYSLLGMEALSSGGSAELLMVLIIGIMEQVVLIVATMPIWTGVLMLGIERSVNSPLSAGSVMQYFHKTLPILGLWILLYTFVFIGFLLLIIPGIYLIYAYVFAPILLVEKNMGIWQSLETSRKSVNKQFLNLFGLFTLLFIANVIAAIPLGIGLIWTVPLSHIALGIAYRNLFGVEKQATR